MPRSHSRAITSAVKQRADQRHDDGDQARHEKIAAAQFAVEPDARIDLQRRIQRLAARPGLLLQPALPDALHVAKDQPRGVGVHAVDDHLYRRAAGLAQLPGEIRAQVNDGVHATLP